jgi:predicted ester cyclase
MSAEQNKANYRRFMEEVWNKGNLTVVDEIASPDLIVHYLPPGTPPGRETLKQSLASLRAAFPDLKITFEDLIAEGDKIAVRCRMTGTHRGPFHSKTLIPPTGRRISAEGIEIWRFDGNGKWVELRGGFDQLALLQQLGTIPEASPSPSEDTPATPTSAPHGTAQAPSHKS